MKKEVFLILLCIILIYNVEARGLGLRSNDLKVKINFEPGFQGIYYYSIIPFSEEPMNVAMYAIDDKQDGTKAELAKYFTVNPMKISNILSNQHPSFSVSVKLPNKIEEPGTHIVHVGTSEVFENEGGIGVKTAVEALFFINVPFNGQYLKYDLETQGVNQGYPIPVRLTFTNLGDETIKELFSDVELVDFNNKTMTQRKTETISLGKQETNVQTLEFSTISLYPGKYKVKATIHHDGKENTIEKNIKIGELKVSIINQSNLIYAGKLNEVEVEVESDWANAINNIYAEIKIGKNPLIKTLSETLGGFEKIKLKSFFDATNIEPGTYDMTIRVVYEDKITEKTTKIDVVKQNMFEMPELSLTNVLFLVIVLIVIIINITLFFILVKKKDEHEKTK